jgi:hypothetical protein
VTPESYRHWTGWTATTDGLEGQRLYAQLHVTPSLHEARRAHEGACQGLWVRRGQVRPHVSALFAWQGGRQVEIGRHQFLREFPDVGVDDRE